MSIKCEYIDFIIPIENINMVYPGGFEKFKSDNIENFKGRMWHDDKLFRDGAMNSYDIQQLFDYWTKLGLKGVFDEYGEKSWEDFCVVESMMGGPTLPCYWLTFDPETSTAYYDYEIYI